MIVLHIEKHLNHKFLKLYLYLGNDHHSRSVRGESPLVIAVGQPVLRRLCGIIDTPIHRTRGLQSVINHRVSHIRLPQGRPLLHQYPRSTMFSSQ